MLSYCKVRNIRPNKDSRGVETYSQNYGKDIPFMLLVFNNTSSNYFQINAEVKARGSKSFSSNISFAAIIASIVLGKPI